MGGTQDGRQAPGRHRVETARRREDDPRREQDQRDEEL